MERITDQLTKLGELSDEELEQLDGEILSEFETVDKQDVTADTVEQMGQLADALDAVRLEKGTRVEKAAELSAAKDAAVSRIKAQTEVVAEGDTDEGEDEVAEEAASDASPDEAEAAGKQSPPMTAGDADGDVENPGGTVVAEGQAPPLAKRKKKATAVSPGQDPAAYAADELDDAESGAATNEGAPEAAVTAAAVVEEPTSAAVIVPPADRVAKPQLDAAVAITAGADIPGVSAGQPLPDMQAVSEAFVQRLHRMRSSTGGDGEQHSVATLVASFPEERLLHANDPDGNGRKIEDVLSPKAVVAAGGICAPVNVRYDLFGLGGTDRPVKAALAPFSADRGGILYVTPPDISDLNGSVALWTLQDDIDAGNASVSPQPTKPCLRVACGQQNTVYTDAITLCLTFGNMGARAYPELVARHNELALVWFARFAETRLLTRIGVLSTSVSSSHVIGAAPDYFVNLDRAAAGYRNRHRMDPNATLRVILPHWFHDELRADLAMRAPGDGIDETIAATDALIDRMFAVRNVNVTWTLDGETGQVFGVQAAGALLDFPATMIWYLFAEGTFLFLDGGTLDLGLVRDSTLNATNDYKMFVESFEGVAKVGLESYRVTSTIKATGAAAALANTN